MVDLFAGLGGWAEGGLAEGYDVIGYDIETHEYGEDRYPAKLRLTKAAAEAIAAGHGPTIARTLHMAARQFETGELGVVDVVEEEI